MENKGSVKSSMKKWKGKKIELTNTNCSLTNNQATICRILAHLPWIF